MSNRVFLAASLTAFAAGCILAQGSPEEQGRVASTMIGDEQSRGKVVYAVGPLTIASCKGWGCTGLIASTDHLYFTSFQYNADGPDSSSFYRTTKNGAPGSEVLLYQETGDRSGLYNFGKPAYPKSDSAPRPAPYVYFAANYTDFGVQSSQLKRVPIAGGAAVVLGYAPEYIGDQDLVTDGSRLFWADRHGIRSMPIAGGAVQTLVSLPDVARCQIGLEASSLYYSFGNQIRRIPKSGGTPVTVTTAPNVITDLYVYSSPGVVPILYWGESEGAVRSFDAWGLTHTHQDSVSRRRTVAVGFDGTRILWIDCEQEGFTCAIKTKAGGVGVTTVGYEDSPANNLQWDATSMYWTNYGSIRRYVH